MPRGGCQQRGRRIDNYGSSQLFPEPDRHRFAGVVFGERQRAGRFGLDQANILIPRSLIGSGLVNVVFTANGKTANAVQIDIK
ncbi:MAG: hypothetical protein ACREAM_18595 [Blastocatellia bacterium]